MYYQKKFRRRKIGRKILLIAVLVGTFLTGNVGFARGNMPGQKHVGDGVDQKVSLHLYVSAEGNDNWSGRIHSVNQGRTDGPLATIHGARNVLRALKMQGKRPKGMIVVEIGQGVYQLPEALQLNQEDGSDDGSTRIVYKGQKDKEVILTSARTLRNWQRVTNADVLDKLSADVRGKIYQVDLKQAGIKEFGSPAGGGLELFFNDASMLVSRYPNKGFAKITGLLNEDPVDIRGTKGDKVGKFIFDDSHINSWKNEKDAWVSGYWFWDWSEQKQKIVKIDAEKQLMEVAPPYHSYGYRIGQWFYGFNLLSEIDMPGEYYVDRDRGMLYFYPPSELSRSKCFVTNNKNVIQLNDVSNVSIVGLMLEGSRETVVTMDNCIKTIIKGCIIRNAGDEGVVMTGGAYNGVIGCDIYGLGAGGIKITAGDRTTLTRGECYADNNYIHHIARVKRMYFPGISLNGVGNRATHNRIADLPHIAIFFSGNDQLMEYNELYNVCYESNDAGAIYAGRNWTMRGNVIRYNYLHDISGFRSEGCVGVYLDDAFSGVDIIGNIFDSVTRAMMIGGGRDNNVLNNIFVNCVPSLHVDARGLGWMSDHPEEWIKEANEKGTILGIAYNKPPYSVRYPELIDILQQAPKAPKGNVIKHNICIGGAWNKNVGFWKTSIEDKAVPYIDISDNVVAPNVALDDSLVSGYVVTDPEFAQPSNPKAGNYQLSGSSPALKLGFKQIPFDKIGLYVSKDRSILPAYHK